MSNQRTQLPLDMKEWTHEDIQMLNSVLKNLVPILPYINSLIGTKPPDEKGWTKGLLAYADGKNWNPCNLGRPGLAWYTGSEWQQINTGIQFSTQQDAPETGHALSDAQYNELVAWQAISEISGSGSPTGMISYQNNGFRTLQGGAKAWDDVQPSTVSLRAGADAPPTTVFIGSLELPLFTDDHAKNEYITGTLQYPHAWDSGTVEFHMHYAPEYDSTATATQAVFHFEASWRSIDGQYVSSSVITSTLSIATSGEAKTHRLIDLTPDLTPTANQNGISSIVVWKLTRMSKTSASDNYTGGIYLLGVDSHYQRDTDGSRSEYVK